MTSSIPTSIPDTQLGLSASEIHILRQHQQIALQSHQGHTAGGNPAASTRGRGGVRGSPTSSRNASVGSHHGGQQGHQQQGRLVLDPGSLAVLGGHFERLMGAIQGRVDQVSLVFAYLYPAPAFSYSDKKNFLFMKPFLIFNFLWW